MTALAVWILGVAGLLSAAAVVVLVAWTLVKGQGSSPAAIEAIGGLAGAIFAAAGLVIALAAVVTLLNVEGKVRDALGKRFAELQRRTDDQIAAHMGVRLLSYESVDWRDLIKRVESSLELYPVPDAIPALAETLSDSALSVLTDRIGLPTYASGNTVRWRNVPRSVAAAWVQKAIAVGGAGQPEFIARLGLLTAVDLDFLSALDQQRRAIALDPSMRDWLLHEGRTVVLCEAATFQGQLEELADLLAVELPLSEEGIRSRIDAARARWTTNESQGLAPERRVQFWVRDLEGYGRLCSEQPRVRQLLVFGTNADTPLYKGRVLTGVSEDFPAEGWTSLDDLLTTLLERFAFVWNEF